jgi:hypothetical protein
VNRPAPSVREILARLALAAGQFVIAAHVDKLGPGIARDLSNVLDEMGERIAQPAPPAPEPAIPRSIAALKLPWPCSAADVRRRYWALARRLHSDLNHGMTDEPLKKLNRLKAEALAAVAARDGWKP